MRRTNMKKKNTVSYQTKDTYPTKTSIFNDSLTLNGRVDEFVVIQQEYAGVRQQIILKDLKEVEKLVITLIKFIDKHKRY